MGSPAEKVIVDHRKETIWAYTSGADISSFVYKISRSD